MVDFPTICTRRRLITSASAAVALAKFGLPLRALASDASVGKPVAEIIPLLGEVTKWNQSNGDTWDPFWADDNCLYAFNCDGRGFGERPQNLAFNRLDGDIVNQLRGTLVNPMLEYGAKIERGPDGATWKACGQECIDGVFYAFVSRNKYGNESGDPHMRQTTQNASLIKSNDRGITWVRSARENYDEPMWPGPSFSTPFFVHYGRNGGDVRGDQADRFVYACSTNGFWDDGDSLVLGRVPRSRLSHLHAADWEFFAGDRMTGQTSWTRNAVDAQPILTRQRKCGQTPIVFVAGLGIYLMISWYNAVPIQKWYEPQRTVYDFFQAPHPWGPWSPVGSLSDDFLPPGYHMYGPSLCARFQQQTDSGVRISMFMSGCPFEDVPASMYKLWHVPLLLRTARPLPVRNISASDSSIRYSGVWYPWTTLREEKEKDLPRSTITAKSWAELEFTGSGVDYLADKMSNLGDVDIELDGVHVGRRSLASTGFPALLNIPVYSVWDLKPGIHVLRVTSVTNAPVNVTGFTIRP